MQKKYLYKRYKKNFIIRNTQVIKEKSVGFYFLRTLENIFFNIKNFESLRRLLSRKIKKKVNFTFFKNSNKIPIFKKPLKVRMGSGRGGFNCWLWKFHKFQKIFEISFLKKYYLINKYLKKLKKKLPCKILLTKRNNF